MEPAKSSSEQDLVARLGSNIHRTLDSSLYENDDAGPFRDYLRNRLAELNFDENSIDNFVTAAGDMYENASEANEKFSLTKEKKPSLIQEFYIESDYFISIQNEGDFDAKKFADFNINASVHGVKTSGRGMYFARIFSHGVHYNISYMSEDKPITEVMIRLMREGPQLPNREPDAIIIERVPKYNQFEAIVTKDTYIGTNGQHKV